MRASAWIVVLLALFSVAAAVRLHSTPAKASTKPAGDDGEFERLTKAKLLFPKPKVQLFWRGSGELKRIANKDFSRGPLLSLKQKTAEYRSLITNATNELQQLIDVIDWHQHGHNITQASIEKLKLVYTETIVKLALMKKTKQALNAEMKELRTVVNSTKNATLDLPENLLKNEIVSLGATARARAQLAATIAVRKAMAHVTTTYKKYVKLLKELLSLSGRKLKLKTKPLKGYKKAVARISANLKKLDKDSMVLRKKSSVALRQAFKFRAQEKAAINQLARVQAAILDEQRRYNHTQKLYTKVRTELNKMK